MRIYIYMYVYTYMHKYIYIQLRVQSVSGDHASGTRKRVSGTRKRVSGTWEAHVGNKEARVGNFGGIMRDLAAGTCAGQHQPLPYPTKVEVFPTGYRVG